jgi:hypothetical protein
MRGVMLPLPQYAFMACFSVKAQGLYFYYRISIETRYLSPEFQEQE